MNDIEEKRELINRFELVLMACYRLAWRKFLSFLFNRMVVFLGYKGIQRSPKIY